MKILLGGARDNNIIDQVKENLIFHGYEVIDITLDNDYKYKNFGEKLINFFNKTLLNSLQYKAKLRINDQYPNIIEKIKTENITHGLIIRPDRFPLEFVSFLRSEIEYLVGYQWDGMYRFPEVKKYKKLFNKLATKVENHFVLAFGNQGNVDQNDDDTNDDDSDIDDGSDSDDGSIDDGSDDGSGDGTDDGSTDDGSSDGTDDGSGNTDDGSVTPPPLPTPEPPGGANGIDPNDPTVVETDDNNKPPVNSSRSKAPHKRGIHRRN